MPEYETLVWGQWDNWPIYFMPWVIRTIERKLAEVNRKIEEVRAVIERGLC